MVNQVPKEFLTWDDKKPYDQNLKRDTKFVPVYKKRHLSPERNIVRNEENKEISSYSPRGSNSGINGTNGTNVTNENIMNKIAKAHESKLAAIKNSSNK